MPCPISERAMRMTQVSSGLITTQALTSAPLGGALRRGRADAERHVEAERQAAAAAAEPTMNLRRESFAA